MDSTAVDRVPQLLAKLYGVTAELREIFGDAYTFTPDGHLVGDLGVALACYLFELEPLPRGTKGMDAETRGGRTVEVKLTQDGSNVGVYAHGAETRPDLLIVMQFPAGEQLSVVYAGEAQLVWKETPVLESNTDGKQRRVSLAHLRRLQERAEAEGVAMSGVAVPPSLRRPARR